MGVQSDVRLEYVDRMKVLSGPTSRRIWPDEVKGLLVAKSFVPGVSVGEVAQRFAAQASVDVYFGRGQIILNKRERIKQKTIETQRLQYRKTAA
jgi:hypothetical protein